MLIILGIALFILLKKNTEKISPEAFFIFRVVLALSGAAFALILTGFVDVEAKWAEVTIRAGGTLAVFVLLYLFNPRVLEQLRKPKPGPIKKIKVPAEKPPQ